MSSTVPEELAPYLTVEQTIVYPISSLSLMYFVYGAYVLLFGTYVHMMRMRDKSADPSRRKSYIVPTTLLFVFSTMFMVDYTIDFARPVVVAFTAVKSGEYDPVVVYLTHDLKKTITYFFGYLIPVLLNITAEWILIHRCFLIWSSNGRIGIPMIVTSIIINALGLANAAVNTIAVSDSRIESNYALYIEGGAIGLAYNILSAVNNSVITLLTAGRIWWIHREVRAYGSFASDTLIQSVCRIIFESGVIYPLCQIIHLIEVNTVSLSAAPIDLYPLLPLSAAIAPTLIMVRAKLGKNVENLQDSVSDIRFNTKSAQREGGYVARSQTHVQTHTTGGLDLAEPFEIGKSSNDKVFIAPV